MSLCVRQLMTALRKNHSKNIPLAHLGPSWDPHLGGGEKTCLAWGKQNLIVELVGPCVSWTTNMCGLHIVTCIKHQTSRTRTLLYFLKYTLTCNRTCALEWFRSWSRPFSGSLAWTQKQLVEILPGNSYFMSWKALPECRALPCANCQKGKYQMTLVHEQDPINRAAKPNDPQRDWRKLQGQWQGNWNPCGSNSGDSHAVGVPKKISDENIQAVNTGWWGRSYVRNFTGSRSARPAHIGSTRQKV